MTESPPAAGLKSREIALSLLAEITGGKATLDGALAGNDDFAALDTRDRAFVRLLLATTLRRRGQLDALIKTYLRHPLPKRANAVRAILQLGAAQLLFLKSPPHAVVDMAVRMCRRFPGQKGLVNAVLRRISETGPERLAEIDERLNTPKWLWESWMAQYGEETARNICRAHMTEPPLDLTVAENPEEWAEKLGGAVISGNTVRLKQAGDITALPGYDDGAWWVQDFAASLPARILLSLLPEGGKGARIIDLCAAPGGKTAQLATAGAIVTAVDRSKRRMEILEKNMARLALSVETVIADIRRWNPDTPPDAILLDAPCSATGTIRRHPDVPFAKKPDDVSRMARLQTELAKSALSMLKPGGLLVYSVCSLQEEEGEKIVGMILATLQDIESVTVGFADAGTPAPIGGADAGLRITPGDLAKQGGADGFFLFVFRRT